jgi:salicylate hydroxylase
MNRMLRIALVGGGIGGLTAALALSRKGFEIHVFEQSSELSEIGAGIGISPNAVKVLRALGLEQALRARGFESQAIAGRDWTTARASFDISLQGAEARFGAPHVQIHRADLIDILANAAASACDIHLNSRCIAVSSWGDTARLAFDDERRETFDLVVGCDGIRSQVRAALHGADVPRFTGNVCWRALIATTNLPPGHVQPHTTLWTGAGGHVVTYFVRGGALVNVVAVREMADWVEESWSVAADARELVNAFPDVHGDLRTLLERADDCFKWGLFDREPLPAWSSGRVTLLGDAAHPMLPFLGQGAAMAIEDAYVLARELARSRESIAGALRAYEAERIPRTATVQLAARDQASVLHDSRRTPGLNVDWLYSYDPIGFEVGAA